jgi:hypothetical protein
MAVAAAPIGAAGAQHAHDQSRFGWDAGSQAVLVLTHAQPTAARQRLTEAYVSQPVLFGHASAFGARLTVHAMLNLEGLTLARGELNTGTYGEGFVDRRHPHSYVHELLATVRADLPVGATPIGLSLTAGRGFAPFGSDDPMARPFVKYPVNHHLAQVLERLVVVAAARAGPMTLEVGLFNGDEPTNPSSTPKWSRFGDSWSARATVHPLGGIEVSASVARVESPEFRDGLGLDQRKSSVTARLERGTEDARNWRYLFAEWARTHDDRRGRRAFTFTSFLAEAAYGRRGVWTALRFEETMRPEEERLIDPFRTPRPQIEFAILGPTRWTTLSAAVGTNLRYPRVFSIAPFVEATYARPQQVEDLAAFVPRDFYGADRLWLLSFGARVRLGRHARRMGRYGVAADEHSP